MNSDDFFLLQIDKNSDDENANSYFMQVYEIKNGTKEIVEDPLLLEEIINNIQYMSTTKITEDMSNIVQKEEQDLKNNLDQYANAGHEDVISNDIQMFSCNAYSSDDELDLNNAQEMYNNLNETQKKIVDSAVQKSVQNSNISLYDEDVFGVSSVDDTDMWCVDMKKGISLYGEQYGYLLKQAQAQVLSSNESRKGKKKGGRKMLTEEERRSENPCEVCGKMFRKKNLRIHLASHYGEKKFDCPQCPSKFKTVRALFSHLNMHQGIKPFQCDVCSKAYVSDAALRCHKMDHQGRIHKCDVCGRTFPRKYSLTEHIRIHTGDTKRFSCKYCGKLFGKPSRLRKHTNIHHKPYYAIIM